jgi:hypothetical protein
MPTNLGQFQEGNPSDTGPTDYVVGYDTSINDLGSPNAERRWKISTLATSISSSLLPVITDQTTGIKSLTGKYESVYTTVNANSGKYESVYTTVNANSGKYESVYTTVNATSASLSGVEIVAFTEKKATPSISGNTLTLNLSQASLFYVNLNAIITTFTLTNIPTSPKVLSFTLQFVFPDNTARTVAWPAGTRWSGGTGPTPTCQTNKVDTFTFVTHDGGSNWFAFVSDQNH